MCFFRPVEGSTVLYSWITWDHKISQVISPNLLLKNNLFDPLLAYGVHWQNRHVSLVDNSLPFLILKPNCFVQSNGNMAPTKTTLHDTKESIFNSKQQSWIFFSFVQDQTVFRNVSDTKNTKTFTACSFKKTEKKKSHLFGKGWGHPLPATRLRIKQEIKTQNAWDFSSQTETGLQKKNHASLKWTYYAELWRLKCIWHMW